jgi:citrate lyase beta subunit
VHTVYVPADQMEPGLPAGWGARALAALEQHAPTATALAEATALDPDLVGRVLPGVLAKLEREPVEDLRLDFEDGYGPRPAAEEDGHATAAARALAAALAGPAAPPYAGLRIKCLEAATRRRGVRTLDLFLGALLGEGELPDGFVVTLPKVTDVRQVEAMVVVCGLLEEAYGLPGGRLRFEIQVETPQSILAADGTATVARMVQAAAGRCSGLHYGTYDYSAACGIAAAYQSMEHPAADHAKAVMQVAAAGTGVRLSDGSTNVLPVGGPAAVHAAWRLHARLVRRSLERGYWQGWDMHPAQLPTRYLATYAFFRDGLPAASARLRAYAERTAGGVLDEPATAQALAAFVARGLDCGALTAAEVAEHTGLDRAAVDGYARRSGAR